jgi:hypothetical protein
MYCEGLRAADFLSSKDFQVMAEAGIFEKGYNTHRIFVLT